MLKAAFTIAAFPLVCCSGGDGKDRSSAKEEPQPAAVVADPAGGDPSDRSLFDFELTGPGKAKASSSPQIADAAGRPESTLRRFPATAAIGPFRIGMTRAEVERLEAHSRTGISASLGEGALVDCLPDDPRAPGARVLEAVPSGYSINKSDNPMGPYDSYSVEFADVGGRARVVSITWDPAAGRFTRSSWRAYLARSFGKPTFIDDRYGEMDWRWCQSGEWQCGDNDTHLPTLAAKFDSNRDDVSLTLSVGGDLKQMRDQLAQRARLRAAAGISPACPRSMTEEEQRVVAAYLNSLTDNAATGAPTIFRRRLLPAGLRQLLSFRLGNPTWYRKVGQGYLARYDVGHSGDPASYVEIRYVIFSPALSGEWVATWEGDAAALRKRVSSMAGPTSTKPRGAAAPR